MRNLKRVAVLFCLTVMAAISSTGTALAAGETITVEHSVVPRAGKLYKEFSVPANMSLSARVNTPSESPLVSPLKRATIKFPRDLSYNPNNQRTPVCPDSALNEQSNLAGGVAAIVDLCPRSVIGTGTANIYLAKVHNPSALISDPELVIFNAGRDSRGNANMKIYAYSKATNYGILMEGALSPQGIQDVAIPVLSNDSATADFVLSIPGNGLTVEDPGSATGTRVVRGLDPSYARTRCSTGTWTTGGQFTLGERSFPAGVDTGPETVIEATPHSSRCNGLAGRARLARVQARGPKNLRRGARNVFRVTVRNTGTAIARQVRIRVAGSGRGQARMPNIAPGAARTVRVPVRIQGQRGSRARILFRISARGASARAVAVGRIRR